MEKMNESIREMGWKPFDDFVGKKGAWLILDDTE